MVAREDGKQRSPNSRNLTSVIFALTYINMANGLSNGRVPVTSSRWTGEPSEWSGPTGRAVP